MGIYNPSDSNNIESLVTKDEKPLNTSALSTINDSFESLLSSANNLTSSSISNLLDWSTKYLGDSSQDLHDNLFNAVDQVVDMLPFFNESPFLSLGRRFKNQETPYGLWAYPIPSAKLYSRCQEMNGLSVWDTNGAWRCLFPRASIPDDFGSALAREDVENDSSHQKGLFFQQYTDYLGFKIKMTELANKKRKEEWEKFKEEQKSKWDFYKDDKKFSDSPKFTGFSTSTTIRTLDDGDVEKVTVMKQFFNDGSSTIKETKEILNSAGERKTIDENCQKLPNQKKSGWFWDNEK
ncbi:hypothetical protein KL910_003884 [Ogataea haglerorum]|nr:hypothetical protein KL910_003884 [Ogataea haglerorum]KAG7788926.1 hypothetical protein KL945_002365 [Ogataea haglerorum]